MSVWAGQAACGILFRGTGRSFVLKLFPFHGPPERLNPKHHFAFLNDSNSTVRCADGNGDCAGRVCDFGSSPMSRSKSLRKRDGGRSRSRNVLRCGDDRSIRRYDKCTVHLRDFFYAFTNFCIVQTSFHSIISAHRIKPHRVTVAEHFAMVPDGKGCRPVSLRDPRGQFAPLDRRQFLVC